MVPCIPLLFTVDAAAVLLAINAPLLARVDALLPALAKVAIEKSGLFRGKVHAQAVDVLVLLHLGVEQGGGE